MQILACCFEDPRIIPDIPLSPEDFFFDANQAIFREIQEIHEEGGHVQEVAVATNLKGHYSAEDARTTLFKLASYPVSSQPLKVAEKVAEASRRRVTRDIANKLAAYARDMQSDIDLHTAEAMRGLESAREQNGDQGARHSSQQLMAEAMEEALKPQEDYLSSRMTTLNRDLDYATGGWRKGSVCVFGAMSHWGKSSYALSAKVANEKRGFRVGIFTAEDPPALWGRRELSIRAEVEPWKLEQRKLTADEKGRVADAVSSAKKHAILIDCIGKSTEWIAREARAIIRNEGLDLVFFDYLGAMVTEKTSGDDQRLRINYVSRTLTGVIKTLDVAGVLFSQVTPPQSGKLTKECLRDSKDVGNAAEVVMLGLKKDDSHERYIKLAKNKPGPRLAGDNFLMKSSESLQCFQEEQDFSYDFGPMDVPA